MSTTVNYKGQTLTTVENATKTLKTAGKYLESDLILTDVTGGGTGLIPYAIRGDAELVKSWSADDLFVADLGGTLPAYTTSATTLKAMERLDVVPADTTDYSFYLIHRYLTVPIYSDNTARKGRCEYTFSVFPYELLHIDANAVPILSRPSMTLGSYDGLTATGTFTRMAYWSSTSAVAWYTATTYGAAQTMGTPSYNKNNGTIIIYSPNLTIRGSTNYLTSAVWATLTDIRQQYVIELYRVPVEHDVRGWQIETTIEKIIQDIANNGGTLR